MTDRLYYADSYCRAFDAVITRSFERDGRPAVTLDRTAFYPTSGGQPYDTGRLGDSVVVETIDAGEHVEHVLSVRLAEGAAVRGEIDWPRRFDHMQQHTGQHLLSAAFERTTGNATVSFHMGAEVSAIDLAREVTPADIACAEDEANRVVWEDWPVSVRFVTADEAASLPLRKESAREGTLRLVEVTDVDLSACGGTHVNRTGAVGMIAVLGWERARGGSRVTFACGGRALRSLRGLRDSVAGSVRALWVLPPDLPSAIERLQAESKAQNRANRDLQQALSVFEAARMLSDATETNGVRIIASVIDGRDVVGLKTLASAIVAEGRAAVALLSDGTPSQIVIARSAGVPADASLVLRQLVARFGGKGGGKADLSQGGGLIGGPHEIAAAAGELLIVACR